MIPTRIRPPAFAASVPAKARGASPSAPRSVPMTEADTPKMPARRISSLRSNSPAANSSMSVFSIGPASLRRYSSSRLRASRSIRASRSVDVRAIELAEGEYATLTARFHPVKSVGPPRGISGALPVYALIFTAGMVNSALAPLGPVYAHDLHLTRVQVGSLFAASSAAMLITALPIGLVTDRIGARRLTVASAVLVAASALGQGVARDFWFLLASRAAFGVAFGAVWTAGVAFIAEERSTGLGAIIPVAGVSAAVGPAFAGVAAGHFGLKVPFVAIAAAAALVALALARSPAALRPKVGGRPNLRAMVHALRENRQVLGAVVLLTAAGSSISLASLLVPLRLRGNGVSVTAIGAILGVGALVYIVTGVIAARLGARDAATAGWVMLGLALSLVLPVLWTATASLVAFVVVRSACNAAMTTIAYPLASAGAADAGVGAGAAIGLVNAAWATSTVVVPLAGGAIAQSSSDRVAFAALVPLTVAAGLWLIHGRERAPFEAARSLR
ncbi:MAG: MFS transporter [Actinobacteria bacterium]|nr:MAG: MFS transporter [Actinomycetota bacterium]